METEKAVTKAITRKNNLKKGAKVSLIILLLYVVRQLASVYQTRYQLVNVLIPESTIWEIDKQLIFTAFISTTVTIVGLILYFFEKYLFVIILVVLTFLANRFIYI